MKKQISVICEVCKVQENAVCQRGFLGFEKCTCVKCGTVINQPLGRGYRIAYWILGVVFALVLLNKIPLLLSALNVSPYIFFLTLLEQWVFILFVIGAFLALRKDYIIRHNSSPQDNSNKIM